MATSLTPSISHEQHVSSMEIGSADGFGISEQNQSDSTVWLVCNTIHAYCGRLFVRLPVVRTRSATNSAQSTMC